MQKKEYSILSIEDNYPDFDLLKKALLENCCDISIKFKHIVDGDTALNYLFKKGIYEKAQSPDIIILDINLPGTGGLEILKRIKSDEKIKHIPVIIFTTSESDQDIQEAYLRYANSYITKTFSLPELFKKIAIIGDYWLKTTEIPTSGICIMQIAEKNNNKKEK